jgi:hypothetical protein
MYRDAGISRRFRFRYSNAFVRKVRKRTGTASGFQSFPGACEQFERKL